MLIKKSTETPIDLAASGTENASRRGAPGGVDGARGDLGLREGDAHPRCSSRRGLKFGLRWGYEGQDLVREARRYVNGVRRHRSALPARTLAWWQPSQ